MLIMDFMVNKAQGFPVRGIEPLWSADGPVVPNFWPLNGEMQGE